MADNTTLNPGTGGDVVATDDIGGVKHQQVKVEWGVDGTATPVSAANPMPIVQTGTHAVNATLTAETTKVIGTVNIAAAQTLATVTTVTAVTAISNALPAGTNAIGKLAANSGVDIGDVDVTTVGTITPGTAATSLGKAEDAVHASGDVGVMMLGVQKTADAALAADGDYVPPQFDANGYLKVNIKAGSGGTAMTDAAAFTRATTSVTPIAGVVETSAPTLTNGNAGALSLTTGGAVRVSVASGGIAGIVDDAAFTPATSEVLPVGFTFDDAAPDSVNEGDIGAARMSANRNIYVTLRDAAGNERGLNVDASGNIGIAANSAVNVAQINGVTPLMGNGASGTGAHRVTLANDSTGVLATVSTVTTVGTVTTITNQGQIVDDAAFTPATTRVMMSGYTADETATDSVDEGDGGAARMTLDRKQITTEYVHAAAGGTSLYSSISTAAVLSAVIKASPGKVWAINVMNINAAARFVRLYNQTGAPASTDGANILWRGIIPGATTGAGFTVYLKGAQFSTGIGIRASTGIADNDTGTLAANELVFNVEYV